MRHVILILGLMMATAALADQPAQIVRNGDFETGGKMWFAAWRPLHGPVQCLRAGEEGHKYLHMRLRAEGDGGLTQAVELPPRQTLSLRILATAWDIADGGVIVDLVRAADGKVLAEIAVGRIVRGIVGCNFDTGGGGQAWLTVRLQGPEGGQGAVEWVRIGPELAEDERQQTVYRGGTGDLVISPGEGLKVETPPSRLLANGAAMVREALAESMRSKPTRIGAMLRVTVSGPRVVEWPAREGFRLEVDAEGARIEAPTEQGALWGMMTLIDLIRGEPGGGVRILSAQVNDRPDLPWRMGWAEGLAGDPSVMLNGIKKLIRLKMNMVIVAAGTPSAGPDDWELRGQSVAPLARQWGLEPVAALSSCLSPSPETLEAAARAAIEELEARYLMVDLCCGPWDSALAQRLGAVARSFDPPVTLLSRFAAADRPQAEARAILNDWPREIVMICDGECLDSPQLGPALRSFAAQGAPYLLEADGDAAALARSALAARARGERCLGLAGWGPDLEETANAAWRVPP